MRRGLVGKDGWVFFFLFFSNAFGGMGFVLRGNFGCS